MKSSVKVIQRNDIVTKILIGWFNFKTREWQEEEPTEFEDFLPQMESYQEMYKSLIQEGFSPYLAYASVITTKVYTFSEQ